ncbi:sigma-54-dependent transcriptional regulator [Botrimarina hoheduenensis]|uniref:Transcriptional regulatory protein ZraR n=1 Tax=Botrimarina hoheduenensis TaxID=2528000 RepID=A0A5C5VWZ4_9BACT|nr:sigma-54 dependent transcriptional regulator [Botrimarina hoheduenensis]TWT43176.1 Transcriptional regulatory protein ZraR [Botrimarina hoheduenensis]
MSHTTAPTPSAAVLVVDDHATARQSVVDVLRQLGHHAEACSSGAEGLAALGRRAFDVVVTDLQMPGMNGLELIREIERRRYPAQVLMVTAHASISTAVEAMRLGAFDYLEKPYDVDRLEASLERALRRGRLQATELLTHPDTASSGPAMIGQSDAMRRLRDQLARIAATDETVLICGESGVGKELVAQTLHANSPRSHTPLVSLNCPVLSEQLTESELFGHCRGAFTGADTDRVGRFEQASGGSLLLDEVTEINLPLQAKLLRVLQERSFERVGSSETRSVDVRVLATTNRVLADEVAAGRFREDLYFRLNVLPVVVPPLRDRGTDVLLLAEHFLQTAAARLHREPLTLEAGARDVLETHRWPGNVRELHNVITRACVLADGDSISAGLIQPWLRQDHAGAQCHSPHTADRATAPYAANTNAAGPNAAADHDSSPATLPFGKSLAEIERDMILATLERFDGHRAQTAEALGIGVRTLSGKLRLYGVAPREKGLSRAS